MCSVKRNSQSAKVTCQTDRHFSTSRSSVGLVWTIAANQQQVTWRTDGHFANQRSSGQINFVFFFFFFFFFFFVIFLVDYSSPSPPRRVPGRWTFFHFSLSYKSSLLFFL